MKKIILGINIVLSVWLLYVLIPVDIQGNNLLNVIVGLLVGGILIINISLLALNKSWLYQLGILIAISLFLAGWFIDKKVMWQVVTGSTLILFMLLASSRLRAIANSFILHAQDGATLMEIKKIDYKNNKLVIRGKMMGTMPTTAQVRPGELWKALTMLSIRVVLRFPKLIYLGWKSAKGN